MKIEEIEKIIDGVFVHGKETPEKSANLPKGQYTVAEAINSIESHLTRATNEGIKIGREEKVESFKKGYIKGVLDSEYGQVKSEEFLDKNKK